jgi:hypothetical protein
MPSVIAASVSTVLRLAVLLAAGLLLAACGGGDSDELVVGVVDDAVREEARGATVMKQLADAGFRGVRVTSIWDPGETVPAADEVAALRHVVERARSHRVRVYVSVYHAGAATTPLTPEARAGFASYAAAVVRAVPGIRDVIVGNEPNLNRFWLPQFGPAGENVAATAYLQLLAETYDAVKAVSDEIVVYGGALSPRGIDRPNSGRDTHSPTTFLRDLGEAYRASGRDRPVMDALALHPYPESSRVPPDLAHPNTSSIGLADYEKLVGLLEEAFGDTAQPADDLPILYAEFGIETTIPEVKTSLYEGSEPARTVDEDTQGRYYRRAIQIAVCSPNVAGILLFHSHDEPALQGWQSGVYYVDGSEKDSLDTVRDAAVAARDVSC